MISKRLAGFYYSDSDFFESLLHLDWVRGKDSTGAFTVLNNGQISVIKMGSGPEDLFMTKEWPEFKSKVTSIGHMAIGHNRKATAGAISSANSHPFVENNIILVHNGVIRNHKELDKETEVDSHSICKAFATKDYESVVKSIDGAFAFIWYDTEQKTLFALRNEERPLWLIETENNIYLASESWMVLGLLSRETGNDKVLKCEQIPSGVLHKFTKGGKLEVQDVTLKPKAIMQTMGSHMYSDEGWEGQVGFRNGYGARYKSIADSRKDNRVVLPFNKKEESSLVSRPLEAKGVISKLLHTTILDKPYKLSLPPLQEEVLFKPIDATAVLGSDSFYLFGKLASPGFQEIEATCTISKEFASHIRNSKVEKLIGRVVQCKSTVNGGPFVTLDDVRIPARVKVYNGYFSDLEVDYVTSRCKCSKCEAILLEEEMLNTSMKKTTAGGFRVVCPKCIDNALKIEGLEFNAATNEWVKTNKDGSTKVWDEELGEFTSGASLQNGEQVSEGLVIPSNGAFTAPSSQSIQ